MNRDNARLLRNGLVATAAIAVIAWVWARSGHAGEGAGEGDAAHAAHQRVSRTSAGETVIHLSDEERGLADIRSEPLVAFTWQPSVTAYGTLIEDPATCFMLRAPVAGTLRAGSTGWPPIGTRLADGTVVGTVEPRWVPTPIELTDRAARLSEARASVEESSAALVASKAAYERQKALNDLEKNVSDKTLQESLARMKGDEARLTAARETVKLLDAPVSPGREDAILAPVPLAVERGGDVVEVLAQPGEAVESGAVLLHVVRYDTMLARVNLMLGEGFDPKAASARVTVLGHEDQPLEAQRLAGNQGADPRTLGSTLLLSVRSAGFALSPGAAVSAVVPAPGTPEPGVVIPRSAVVRYLGRPWVYVEAGDNTFTRRAVELKQPLPQGWFTPGPLAPGDRVVTVGAEMLLSEDLNSRYKAAESEGD